MVYDRSKVIPVKLTASTTHGEKPHYYIKDHGVTVYNSSDQGRRDRALEFMKNEHGSSRVAQAKCQHGPCDYPRLTDPRTTPSSLFSSLVLCDHHGREINRVQGELSKASAPRIILDQRAH